MKVKHNKKRNVGILFSQLSEYISTALVENREKDAHIALKILKKHFAKGTALHKEFRLFRALVTTSVPSPALAVSIINEAKTASRGMNISRLRQEKSALIKDINYKIAESNFYERRVDDYKAFATVQTLLNNWRSKDPDINVITKFESSLHEHLLKEKKDIAIQSMSTPDVNRLTVQIMQEKFQETFGQILSEGQAALLKQYIFSCKSNSNTAILKSMSEVKARTLGLVTGFEENCDNSVLREQIDRVQCRISILPTDRVDDSILSQYLTLMKLVEELSPGDKDV